ncbi:MAG: hypothetical protein H6R24_1078 [Proteobacteria bacterium]|jgi:hypothetical protein|nr:hypothetical protein [Pseudomonadota bacterium]
MTRQAEIIRWLVTSHLAIPLRHGRGFFVLRGPRVRLADGTLLDALDWLQAEGFGAGLMLDGYHVAYTPPGGEYAEKLTFFEMQTVYDAPFSKLRPNHAAALLAALRGDSPH